MIADTEYRNEEGATETEDGDQVSSRELDETDNDNLDLLVTQPNSYATEERQLYAQQKTCHAGYHSATQVLQTTAQVQQRQLIVTIAT